MDQSEIVKDEWAEKQGREYIYKGAVIRILLTAPFPSIKKLIYYM
jgi:hypothetical protein